MRFVVDCNPNKRGCDICADVKKTMSWDKQKSKFVPRRICPYNVCPYHELDDIKHYSEYDRMAKKQGKSWLEEWLKKIFEVSEK